MNKNQTSLLLTLAKKLEGNQRSRESALKTLNSAGIVTKEGKISKSYPNLSRVIAASK